MPGQQQQLVVRKHIAKHVRVRENCAQHQCPGDNAPLIDRDGRKKVAAAKGCFADKRASDAMSDGVHL
jgi:hypothetical protein